MALYELDGIRPELPEDGSAFVADTADVIGNVRLGRDVSVWFNAVLRGDNERIDLGPGTNVQDGAVLHTDPGCPLTTGEGVTIGHAAIVHGCTIGENTLIGMGATILNRAVIGRNSIVGANALVTEGKTFPDNSLIVGAPARVARTLTEDDAARIKATAAVYLRNNTRYRAGLKKIG